MSYQYINWSANLFKDLSQPDSIVVLLYLAGSFILGAIGIWWMRQKEIKSLQKIIQKQEKELQFIKTQHSESTQQKEEKSNEQPGLISDLNQQVTELKQAHFFLKKDYDLALQALSSAKEQAEEWQKSALGSNILPQTNSPANVIAAREKIKSYLQQKLDHQSEGLSFNKEMVQKIGEERIAPIDHLDEDTLVAFAELIPEED